MALRSARICRFSDVPIVMLSSRSKESDILRGLQVGADDYIIKPLIPMVFLARMKAVLRRSTFTESALKFTVSH